MRLAKLSMFLLGIITISLTLTCGEKSMAFNTNRFKFNSPSFKEESFNGSNFRLSKPSNYLKGTSTKTTYPLVVYLHGAGERGTDNRKASLGLTYLGNGFGSKAKQFQRKFPCFVYVPQTPQKTIWNETSLSLVINTIEHLKTKYPIDTSRLYLIGYSMGGSGSFSLASLYHDYNGQLFAGIIRLAGQGSFSDRVHEIISKSSLWLHIGRKDTALRINKARKSYAFQKNKHPQASERINHSKNNGQDMVTSTLIIDTQEKYKLTEYSHLGHNVNREPFKNPAVLQWLFSQKLP